MIDIISVMDKWKGKIVVCNSPYVKWKVEREKYLYDGIKTNYKLRQVLPNEIVIEFDFKEEFIKNSIRYKKAQEQAQDGINKVKEYLISNNIYFWLTDHKGKSPHIRLLIEGLENYPDDERKKYKMFFIEEILSNLMFYQNDIKYDNSLCGIHLVSMEGKPHWKTIYKGEIEKLIFENESGEIPTLNKKILEKSILQNKNVDYNILEEGTKPGNRNNDFFRFACSLKSKGVSKELTLKTILNTNKGMETPLAESEVRTLINSAYSYNDKIEMDNYDIVKQKVLDLLLQKKRNTATELIVKYIKKNNYIYTTRSDEKAEVWVYNEGIYTPNGKTYIKEVSRLILDKTFTTHLGNEIVNKIIADTGIDSDEFFRSNYIDEVAIENGILNIITREINEFDPKKIFFNKLPIKYEVDKDCPFIKKHFKEVLKHENDSLIIQELFGYLLLKQYRYEKAFMCTGTGRNGKSKSVELMKRFLGIDNTVSIPLQHFETDSFAMGEMFNKMANLGSDISSKSLKETGNFKALTGRDMISAARKFLPRVNFENYAKMIFCANELPRTDDISNAFFERWIILDFPYTFLPMDEINLTDDKTNLKEADPEIIDKLTTEEELSGLLNWSLEGLNRLIKNKGFSNSKTMDNVKNTWFRKSNSFSGFLMDEIEENFDSRITKEELRMAYSLYCRKHKLTMVGDKTVKSTLTTTYSVTEDRWREEGKQIPYWKGILFKSGNELGMDGMDGMGFSTYGQISNLPKTVKPPTKSTTLTESFNN